MRMQMPIMHALSLLFTVFSLPNHPSAAAAGGRWDLLHASTGVSAMHMQLLHNDRVVIFDRTDFGPSNLSLPNGNCRNDPNELALKLDCTAHSIEYNVATNTFRPLTVLTDTWCSSGTVNPDGILVQTGGFNDGERAVRKLRPENGYDWEEINPGLAVRRWYATNQILPDGKAIIIGGRRQFNYEFYPKSDLSNSGPIGLPLLRQTLDHEENNLYPFVHLNVDGNLFIFANNRAILLDYKKNSIVRNYPVMPDGDPRNYPSSGSSILLPLKLRSSVLEAEVMVCGGAAKGAYNYAQTSRTYFGALSSCGRIKITDESPSWSMEQMPIARVMGDMLLLPTGEVLIVNGAGSGAAGWENGRDPVLNPVLYSPDGASGSRFRVQQASNTPRLYHSTAVLLRDGRVLVGGSNPHVYYNFSGVQYPTDLSLEAFSPDYLDSGFSSFRPSVKVEWTFALELSYGKQFTVGFTVEDLSDDIAVTMIAPPFTTHSFSMNQRLLVLNSWKGSTTGGRVHEIGAMAPASGSLAPPGYYMMFVVNKGVPSEGIWVHIQ